MEIVKIHKQIRQLLPKTQYYVGICNSDLPLLKGIAGKLLPRNLVIFELYPEYQYVF
jgi:hypothetical protein